MPSAVHRAALGVVVGAVLAIASATAHARPAPSSAWLDADAPVVVSVRPSLLAEAAAALARGAKADARQLANELETARAESTAALGADLFEREGWQTAGFDPDAPVLASIAAIDAPRTAAIFDQLFALHEWSDAKLRRVSKTFWRSRAVVTLSDPQRATRTVRALAAYNAHLYAVEEGNASDIAMLLGGSARKAKSVEERLRKRQIVAIGWLEGLDAVIALRVLPKSKLLVIDVVGTFAGVPAVWSRDSKKLLAAIERNPGSSRLPTTLARGVGPDALAADLALWVQPEPLLALAKAGARHDALRTLALTKPGKLRRRELHRRAAEAVESCELLRPLVARGPLLDLALTLDLDDAGLRARVAWGLRKDNALASALAVRDDALMTWPGPKDAVLAAAHYLPGLRALRALPRPKPLRKSSDELDQLLASCGSGASFVVALFGWHALAGLALDELSAESPELATAIDGVGNGALAVRAFGATPFDLVGAVALAFDETATRALSTALDATRGAGTSGRVGRTRVTRWLGAIPEPFRFSPGTDDAALGATMGDTALSWFLATAGPSPEPPIARWRVSVPALLEQLPELPSWLRAVAGQLDRLDGRVALAPRALVVDITPHLR